MSFVSFLKVYTLPIFVLLLGFGLYYLVFVYTNKPDDSSIAHEIQTSILAHNSQTNQSHSSQDQKVLSVQTPQKKQIQEPNSKKLILPINNPYIPSTNNNFQTYIVLPKVINIRQHPEIASETVGKLKQNQILEVEFIDKGWAKIKTLKKENTQEQSGWVLARLLTPAKVPQTIVSTVPPSPVNLVSSKHDVAGRYLPISSNVRIRSSPDLASEVIGKLESNKTVDVQVIQNGWAKIADGWVSLKFLKKQED